MPTTYCTDKNSATITVQFADKKEVIQIDKCPITVETGKRSKLVSNFDDNYSDNSGGCSYNITYKDGTSETVEVGMGGPMNYQLDKEVTSVSTSDTWQNSGVSIGCPAVNAPTNPRGTGFEGGRLYDSLHIEGGCYIKAWDSDGILRLYLQGECPVQVSVACDDECPEGMKKCRTTSYPGYCCICCGC